MYHTSLCMYRTSLCMYHTSLYMYHTSLCMYHTSLYMYRTSLTWQEQENLGSSLILRPCPEHCNFASTHVLSWNTKSLHVGPTGRYTHPHNPKPNALKFTLQQRMGALRICCRYGMLRDSAFLLRAHVTCSAKLIS